MKRNSRNILMPRDSRLTKMTFEPGKQAQSEPEVETCPPLANKT